MLVPLLITWLIIIIKRKFAIYLIKKLEGRYFQNHIFRIIKNKENFSSKHNLIPFKKPLVFHIILLSLLLILTNQNHGLTFKSAPLTFLILLNLLPLILYSIALFFHYKPNSNRKTKYNSSFNFVFIVSLFFN